MQPEQQHLPLPSLAEDVSESNYYILEETNPLVLAQYLARFFFRSDNPKAIGFSGQTDIVPRAGLLCNALNPSVDIGYSTGVTSDGIPVAILCSYTNYREKRIQKILSQNDWDTYALLMEKDQFMNLTPPDFIGVDGDKRIFTWKGQNLTIRLYLWERWEVDGNSFAFHEIDLLVKMLPQKEKKEPELDDRFCGAIVAIKVAQGQGMLDEEQAFILCKAFCKTHDLILNKEEGEAVLASERVNRYVNLFVEKNK